MTGDLQADYGSETIKTILGWEDNMSKFARENPDDWEAREDDLFEEHFQDRINELVEGEDG